MLALDTAKSCRATYADVRVVESQEETLRVRNGGVEALTETTDRGLGVRVISQGAWGFASTSTLGKEQVKTVRCRLQPRSLGSLGDS